MKSDLLQYLTPMLRARRFDETLCDHGSAVNDTYHVSIGLEASAVAIACAQKPGDSILLNHRNHGQLAACGSDLEMMYREIFGRDGNLQRGKLGSFHLVDPQRGIPYVSAMLGGSIPLAIGIGFANSRKGNGAISFAYLGDGAMEEGIVYEGFNIASAWKVPVVIVCDNNGSQSKIHTSKFYDLAQLCGLASFSVDAQKPFDVFSTVEVAAETARVENKPHFVEIVSKPWPGNGTGNHPRNITGPFDVTTAHSKTDEWSLVDPLTQLVRELLSRGIELSALLQIDANIRAEVDRAIIAALSAPLAPTSAIYEDVWGTE